MLECANDIEIIQQFFIEFIFQSDMSVVKTEKMSKSPVVNFSRKNIYLIIKKYRTEFMTNVINSQFICRNSKNNIGKGMDALVLVMQMQFIQRSLNHNSTRNRGINSSAIS